MTSPNAVSIRTSNSCRLIRLCSERETRNSAQYNTIRGSGLHHRIGWPAPNQGKMPRRYAAKMRSGDRSPPAASSPLGSSSADSSGGNGLSSRNQVIMMLETSSAWRHEGRQWCTNLLVDHSPGSVRYPNESGAKFSLKRDRGNTNILLRQSRDNFVAQSALAGNAACKSSALSVG